MTDDSTPNELTATERETLKQKLLTLRSELVTRRSDQMRERERLNVEVEDEGDASLRANTEDELVTRVESGHARLAEIDRALEKFDTGEYGLDEETGEPIEYERLALLPWTRYSVETQEEMERR
jgi:RNA polymerase-binding transcription factor DksA